MCVCVCACEKNVSGKCETKKDDIMLLHKKQHGFLEVMSCYSGKFKGVTLS